MAYLNKIDINGRTYYLQHLTDGKYEAKLPNMTQDAKIIIQDSQYSNNVGDAGNPVYIKDNRVVASDSNIGNAVTPIYMKRGDITPLSENVGSTTNPIYMNAGAITASNETVGSGIIPIYMQDGVITPSDSTVGSGVKPIHLNSGAITESDATVGSGIVPTYMSAGTITASTETVGSNIKPIYMNNGEITVSNANVGSDIVPTYMSNGEITASTATVGSNVKPIYLNAGTVTVSDANVGSGIIPIYMANGTITQTEETVGSGIKPIYMNSGVITASTSTIGATNQPVYMNSGEITVCSDNVGNAGVPVYMANGVITACNTIPVASGGTGATTAEQALINFGLTATAAELNALDGITATVTELNYVDGVTSSIQNQFNDHDGRIETIEAFFKEADIDASQEFIDTLKEIQSYIADDKTGATKMAESIKGNKDAIDVLNGDSSTVGSVAKAVADAKTALESEIVKKVDKVDGKGLSDQNYTADEKRKLEGIETGANKYVHPSHDAIDSGFYKISFDKLGHVSSVVAVTKEDITALGIPAQDTTYEVAIARTETEAGVDGLLSATDKEKYDVYETTIAGLQQQIAELKALVESYHPVTEPEPEPEPEPDETE